MWWMWGCGEEPKVDGRGRSDPAVHSGGPATGGHTGRSGVHSGTSASTDVVLVVLDDVGTDEFAAYGVHPDQPKLPVLESLAAEGLVFDHAYGAPTCSPARAALYTGRHGRRSGMGRWILPSEERYTLPPQPTLATVLAAASPPWATAFVGKWHLVSYDRQSPWSHPGELGFVDFRGPLGNVGEPVDPGNGRNYFRWERATVDGLSSVSTYATTGQVDDALEVLASMPSPSLLVLSLNAAHVPLHVPPAELVSTPVDETSPDWALQRAAAEAADHELGRLLGAMDPERRERTTFVVVGDNGTDRDFIRPPFSTARHKGTLFDGGVRVPLVVSGPLATPGRTEALVHVVDVLPTLAELSGAPLPEGPLDGASFAATLADPGSAGPREYVYSELFAPNGPGPWTQDESMVRDRHHKLVRDAITGTESLYRYVPGALDEGPDLLVAGATAADLAAADVLRGVLAAHLDALAAGVPVPLR
jgi:arylsulfatase B